MPEYLAIDWERHHLAGVEADVSAAGVRVRRALSLTWPSDLDPHTRPQQAGMWLRQQLQQAGVASTQVLLVVPREQAVVRPLELPAAPDEELPDLVRLQTATRSSLPLDQLLLDFVPLPPQPNSPGRSVLVASLPREAAERVRGVITAAGLELLSIGLSPFATADVVARIERREGHPPGEHSLVISRHGERIEISLLQNRHVLFTHSAMLEHADQQKYIPLVLSEISRSRVSLQGQFPGLSIDRAWVVGGEDDGPALVAALESRLGCTVRLIDPLRDSGIDVGSADISGNRTLYAGPVGMLLSKTAALVDVIDFLNPRRAPARPRQWKLRGGLAAAAVLALALAYGGFHWKLSSVESSLAASLAREQAIQLNLDNKRHVLESADLLARWSQQQVNLLAEHRRLDEALPGTAALYLSDIRFTAGTESSAPRIQSTGFARSRADVERLHQELAARRYRIHPREITPSRRDEKYPFRFELEVELPLDSSSATVETGS